ncbi:MAG: DUF3301 domain-containing protein [Pseudomonadota bacterium]
MEWFIAVLALLAWAWYSGTVVREAAVRHARRLCQSHGQQLLDETVSLQGIRLKRDRTGRVRLLRRYGFEFSDDGERRHHGELSLMGQRLLASDLGSKGATYEQRADGGE